MPNSQQSAALYQHNQLSHPPVPHTQFSTVWPSSHSERRNLCSQLKVKTSQAKDNYTDVCDEFRKSLLLHEVSIKILETAVRYLYDLGDENKAMSIKFSAEQLLLEILRRQSYMNFDVLYSLIQVCGTTEDADRVSKYKKGFGEYIHSRCFKDKPDMIIFVLDADQQVDMSFKNLAAMLSQMLGINRSRISICKPGIVKLCQLPLSWKKKLAVREVT